MTIQSTCLFSSLFVLLLFWQLPFVTGQDLVEQLPNVLLEDLEDVAMNADGYGIAIATAGVVLLTNDFGQNWEERSGTLQNTVRVEAIPETEQGFLMVFRSEIRRSDDGGQNWTDLTIPELNSNDRLEHVSLPSDDVFYVCSKTDILKTFNGGDSWILLSLPAMGVEWQEIYFDTETTGWLSDDMGNLYYTTNGGSSWVLRNADSFSDGFVFNFLNQNIGYAAVYRDLYKTIDGGVNWELILTGAFGSHMDQVEIIDEQNIVFSQRALINYVTNDGGLTVERGAPLQYGGNHGYLTSLPDGRVWATTDYGGLAYSDDSGTSWVDQLPGSKHGFLTIDFVDENVGWAAGRSGQVAKTNNGGDDWLVLDNDLPEDPIDEEQPFITYVAAFSETEALLGASRSILHTTDGGNNWNALLEPSEENRLYKSVTSFNSNIWALQNNGILFISNDKGESWTTSVVDDGFTSYDDMYFVTENLGFIVGFNGDVIRTTDGGITWTQLSAFTEERLQAPYFQNELEGWILVDGFSSFLYHTVDGGESWEIVETSNSSFWSSIHSNEFGAVYLFGGSAGSGRVIRSLDNGENWETYINESITSYQDYAYASSNDSYSYWACGFGGYIGRVDISLVETQEIFTQEFAIYPNPGQGVIQLDIPFEWEQKGGLRLINMYGQVIKEVLATKNLDLSGLQSGTYIIEVQYGQDLYVGKLLLK